MPVSWGTRALLSSGAIGGPLFIIGFLVTGATRTDYDPLRHPISSLSIGNSGWVQVANFITTGVLMFVFAIGLTRAFRLSGGSPWGPRLVGLYAIGLIGSGIFITDPLNGYPLDTPLVPVERSYHGRLHDLFGIPVFFGLPAACLVVSRHFKRLGERGWASYSVSSGVAMFLVFVLATIGFRQAPGFADYAGALQRLSIVIGWTWITLLAIHLLRAHRPTSEGRMPSEMGPG